MKIINTETSKEHELKDIITDWMKEAGVKALTKEQLAVVTGNVIMLINDILGGDG